MPGAVTKEKKSKKIKEEKEIKEENTAKEEKSEKENKENNEKKEKKEKTEKTEKTEKKEKKETKSDEKSKEEKKEKRGKKRDREGEETEENADKEKKSKKNKNASSSSEFDNQEVEEYRKQKGITIDDSDCLYKPFRSFKDSNIEEKFLSVCKNFSNPTPIQSQAWPIILKGKDMVGIASTGSGKTIAFAIPSLAHMEKKKPFSKIKGALTLVLSPTRELAMQIHAVFEEAGKSCDISSVCIYGGMPKNEQRKALQKNPQVIVATPGRLLDFINEESCPLGSVSYLVLDEADRMLDLGFEQEVRKIISYVPKKRQTVMFSATWPKSIQELSREFLINPVQMRVGSEDLSAAHTVTQIVEVIDPNDKFNRVDQLLREYHKNRKNKILLFVLYKKEATQLENFLLSRKWDVMSIHGDKNQIQRTEALEKFKNGSQPLLIATDVAARGLDIPLVEYVINVTFPLTVEDYVHRIGRTGRGGNTGVSHTLFTQHDKAHAGELVNVLKEAGQKIPEELGKFGLHTKKKEHKLYGAHFKDIDTDKKATKIVFD